MSEQCQSPTPAELDRLNVGDLLFAPPGPGVTGTLEELQQRYRDKAEPVPSNNDQGENDVGV